MGPRLRLTFLPVGPWIYGPLEEPLAFVSKMFWCPQQVKARPPAGSYTTFACHISSASRSL